MVKKLKIVKAHVSGLRMHPKHKPTKGKTTAQIGGYWRKRNYVQPHVRHLR